MIAIIGDIHGCYFTLVKLTERIRIEYGDIEIFSVGDIVDRGMGSAEAVEYLINENIQPVLGNHDYMFYISNTSPNDFVSSIWHHNGSAATLFSYKKNWSLLKSHLDFVGSLPLFYNLEGCFISHAGVSKKNFKNLSTDGVIHWDIFDRYYFEKIMETDSILWNRDKLANLRKLQVVGHSQKSEVQFDVKNNSVYVDTSAFSGNLLSAVIVDNGSIVNVVEIATEKKDLYLHNQAFF